MIIIKVLLEKELMIFRKSITLYLSLLFIFPLLSEQTDWATTRFEKSWKKSFEEMADAQSYD